MAISPLTIQSTQGQTGFFNAYPYTDFHELNLDFLLATYKTLVDKANEIIGWANNHQIEYEEAIARLTAVENEIDTFEAEVTAQFERLKADIEADFAQQKAELAQALADTKAEIDAEMQRLITEVNAAIDSFEYRFTLLRNQLIAEINQLKADINRQIAQLYETMEANNQYVFRYVENRLDQFINDFPEVITVYVYNPYRGEVTDVQTAIIDIYDVARIWGLTAEQFDSLGLTATEFDSSEITAVEFDTIGYKLLFKDPAHYMLSPFTGEYVPLQEVISDLANLHTGGLTATAYDAKDLTVDEFEAYDITAFNFDWFGHEIIA